MLPEEEFRARVIPVLSSLFASPDQGIRTSLLENVAEYAPALPESAVENTIFPQLSKSLQSPNAFLRESTLKALLPLAPKLSQRTLTGPLLKLLAKLQVRPPPLRRAACCAAQHTAHRTALAHPHEPPRHTAHSTAKDGAAARPRRDLAAAIVPCRVR